MRLPHATLLLALLPPAAAHAQDPPSLADPEDDVARYRATIRGVDTPRAVAVDRSDRIFVAESGADRVRVFDADGAPAGELGGRGDQSGQLLDPRGLCVAPDGVVYVADTGNHRVQAFEDPDGSGSWTPTLSLGGLGSAPGELHTPLGLATDGERLLVCDAGNRRVQVFSRSGERLGQLEPAVPFERPVDVDIDAEGRIVVGDAGAYRCIVFDGSGKEIRRFGDVGWFPGLFSLIGGVATSRGRIYVTDAENHRVQEFAPDGTLLAKWGLHAIRPREGRGKLHYPAHLALAPSGNFAAVAEPFDDRVQIFGRGSELVEGGDVFRQNQTQPSPHYGFRASGSGNWLAVGEPETHELLVLDTQIDPPRLVSRVGGYGERMGLFRRPSGIHMDGASQTLVTTERGGRRLQLLDLRVDPEAEVAFDREMARFIRTLDFERLGRRVAGVELEWPVDPTAVTRDAQGRIYLLDAANERVHVLSPELQPLATFGGHGREEGRLRGPSDLELAPDGETLYVVDALNRRVQAFGADGTFRFAFDGSPGEPFVRPFGVTVARDGRVFVTDTGSHRLLWFEADGTPVGAMGGEGIQRGKLYKPRDVEVDGRGRIVVIDHGNHRAMVLDADGGYLDCFGSRLYTKPARLPHTFDPAEYEE